jgi:hypothetical protein
MALFGYPHMSFIATTYSDSKCIAIYSRHFIATILDGNVVAREFSSFLLGLRLL